VACHFRETSAIELDKAAQEEAVVS
jgi:hypothetical protein